MAERASATASVIEMRLSVGVSSYSEGEMPAPRVDPHRQRRRMALCLSGILAFVVAIHGRTFAFEFSYLDDDVLIADNQSALSHPSRFWRCFSETYFPAHDRGPAYYRPLVNASYVLDAVWSGGNPRGYHVTNVILHAVASGLLFLLLRRFRFGDGRALFGALLFAAHPALTETVAWIPGRNDSLLTIFALASWLCLLSPAGTSDNTSDWGNRIPAIKKIAHHITLLAALFTKETALALPIVFLIYLLYVERQSWRTVLRPWLWGGWSLALGVYLVMRGLVIAGANAATSFSVLIAIRNSPAVVIGGLGKLVVPTHLSVLAIPEDTWIWPGIVACGLFVAARLIQKRPGRRTLFGLACFTLFLIPGLPASNLLILENRLYLPAVGLIIAVLEIAEGDVIPKLVRLPAAALAIGLFVFLTFTYGTNFRNRMTFAQAAVNGSPRSSLAHRNLGVAYHMAGETTRARRQYEEALAQDPAEPVAHNNLAVILMAEGNLPGAERELREELRINPHYARAHQNLALVLDGLGRRAEAAQLRESLNASGSPAGP